MATLVGVDGGGSHSETAVANDSLDILSRHRGPRGNVARGDEEDAAERLATSILGALADADRSGPIDVLVIGAAGAGHTGVASSLQYALANRLDAGVIDIVTDADIALLAAFPDGDGIVVSGGTGSIAVGRTAAGLSARAGGHGWRFGDDGSGYAIGRAAVNAVLKAIDGRGPETELTTRLSAGEEAGGLHVRDWLEGLSASDTAALVDPVAAAAQNGDPVARRILEQAASDLVDHIAAVQYHLNAPAGFPVAFNGGLLDPDLPVRTLVEDEVRRRALPVEIRDEALDPVLGALRRAAHLWAEADR